MADLSGHSIGRYHIIEPLGEGGMATVYRALDTRLERDVAVKFIRVDQFAPAALEHMLARFEREARTLAKLSHPNIVRIYDYGEHEGSPYLVMEYIPGGTLKRLAGKPMPWREAVRLVLPAVEALACAHAENIIHRDVKPANILLAKNGCPMLSDFGVAKILDVEAGATLTGTNVGVGTPEYMAPEQWMNQVVPQTDIYALGVVFYELVTGRKPYTADTPAAVLLKQSQDPLPRPRDFAPDLPGEVEAVIFKALEKKPENRYGSMEAFAAALERLAGTAPMEAHRSPLVEEKTSLYPPPWEGLAKPVGESSDLLGETLPSPDVSQQKAATLEPEDHEAAPRRTRKTAALAGMGVAALILTAVIYRSINPVPAAAPEPGELPAVQEVEASPTTSPTDTPESTPTPEFTIGSTKISARDGMEMMYVPEGEFLMGAAEWDSQAGADEKPQHTVWLDAFWIDRTEVTNAMYARCVSEGTCKDMARFLEKSSHPVVGVDWTNAKTYCEWAGRRLPTEAEWEKAARGTDGREYPWGNDAPSCDLLNYDAGDDCVGDTVPVGSYPVGASPYGALDMAGNVLEWVADWYYESHYSSSPERNPEELRPRDSRVIRGGSWNDDEWRVRSSFRNRTEPFNLGNTIGFRCAVSAATAETTDPEPPPTPEFTIGPTKISAKDGMEMVYVPEGDFLMGAAEGDSQAGSDEKPQHTVWLDAFWIDRTEVTNGMYDQCAAEGICQVSAYADDDRFNDSEQPVVGVTWNDASAYCAWAGRRLPSEAEWEKAARGTDGRTYPWGNGSPNSNMLNMGGVGDGYEDTAPVGSYPAGASPYGALDTAGNAWEWTADWHDSYDGNSPERNPQGPGLGEFRVLRGGSWRDNEVVVRASFRFNLTPDGRDYGIGFRCASSASAAESAPPKPTPEFAIGSTQVSAKDGMEMVYVPEGEFLMGAAEGDSQAQEDEKPQHKVWLDSFWIDRTEVTNGMYEKCAAEGICQVSTIADYGPLNGSNQPVVRVNWHAAGAYCAWAGRRLPTEAEWEKAARGTEGRTYPWGNDRPGSSLLNMRGAGDGSEFTAPVGSYLGGASPYGALDMAGNVWEWAADWYGENYYSSSPQRSPAGPGSGVFRVMRGGAWFPDEGAVRASNRNWEHPGNGYNYLGFRCAVSAAP